MRRFDHFKCEIKQLTSLCEIIVTIASKTKVKFDLDVISFETGQTNSKCVLDGT